MRNILIVIFLSTLMLLSFAETVQAQPCKPIYGGGPSCVTVGGLVIDMMVMNPQTKKMVNNLTERDPKYKPGDFVTFQIKVSNDTNTTIPLTEVQNAFPKYITYSKGEGSFNEEAGILTFRIYELQPNRPQTFTIVGQIAKDDQLPPGNNLTCVTNQAVGIVLDPASGKDTSTFCIEKRESPTPTPIVLSTLKSGFPVLPAPTKIATTPSTGNETLITLSLVSMGLLGQLLRHKAKM